MNDSPKNGPATAKTPPAPPKTCPNGRASAPATETPSSESEARSPHESGPARKRYGKDSAFVGKPGRSGPPKGNANALRHGLKAGKLPHDAKYIEVRMNLFRRELEAAVLAVKGEIGLVDAANIQTAMKWERHGALALRWLTKEGDKLKPVERLQFSREIARASTERDRAISALNLNERPAPWLVLGGTEPDGEEL